MAVALNLANSVHIGIYGLPCVVALKGQISFLFDGHGVFFSSFAIENLITKKMIPHMPCLAMFER